VQQPITGTDPGRYYINVVTRTGAEALNFRGKTMRGIIRPLLTVILVCGVLPASAAAQNLAPIMPAGHTAGVTSVALSANGKYLVTGSKDTSAILWDLATGHALQVFQVHVWQLGGGAWQVGSVNCVAVSADGKRVVAAPQDKGASLWDSATGKNLQFFQAHGVTGVAISAAG
jgi:WD40 repeat protein